MISNPLKKLQKISSRKVINEKSDRKVEFFFTFITYFISISKNPILHLSPLWEAPFCQNKSRLLYLSTHTLYNVHFAHNPIKSCVLNDIQYYKLDSRPMPSYSQADSLTS